MRRPSSLDQLLETLICRWYASGVGLLLLVQSVGGGVGLLGGREGDEAEAAAATGLAVLQDDLEGLA